ncbi:zinc ribbon domain-containing protein [bacterium]|nr:zinc ribbon domain-containing protein [bacterium]
MPVYEYRCKACNKEFEVTQAISDPPLEKCPKCKGRIEKLISTTSFTLSGGGWYKDGYTSASPKKEPEKKPEVKKTTSEDKK